MVSAKKKTFYVDMVVADTVLEHIHQRGDIRSDCAPKTE